MADVIGLDRGPAEAILRIVWQDVRSAAQHMIWALEATTDDLAAEELRRANLKLEVAVDELVETLGVTQVAAARLARSLAETIVGESGAPH